MSAKVFMVRFNAKTSYHSYLPRSPIDCLQVDLLPRVINHKDGGGNAVSSTVYKSYKNMVSALPLALTSVEW